MEKLEDQIQKTEYKLREFSKLLSEWSDTYQQLLKKLNLTSEQLKEFAENPKNFDPDVWHTLQIEKKKLDEQLSLEISHVSDPLKTKKTQSERASIQKHWLFVR